MESKENKEKKSSEKEVKEKKDSPSTNKAKPVEAKKTEVEATESKPAEEKPVVKEEPKKATKVLKYAGWAYCNIVGSSSIIRQIVKRKFRRAGKKTAAEWKEIFEKEGLI